MKILGATFVTSLALGDTIPHNRDGPIAHDPVIALVGRSNVGKSSLINSLVARRIARSGSTPGTTRLINAYRVRVVLDARAERTFVLADLPGYGYARGGDVARQEFDELTRRFFDDVGRAASKRAADTRADRLAGILLVVDARHPGLDADRRALAWAIKRQYPLAVVAAKVDRMTRAAGRTAAASHAAALGRSLREIHVVSTRTGAGIPELWTAIDAMLQGLL